MSTCDCHIYTYPGGQIPPKLYNYSKFHIPKSSMFSAPSITKHLPTPLYYSGESDKMIKITTVNVEILACRKFSDFVKTHQK